MNAIAGFIEVTDSDDKSIYWINVDHIVSFWENGSHTSIQLNTFNEMVDPIASVNEDMHDVSEAIHRANELKNIINSNN